MGYCDYFIFVDDINITNLYTFNVANIFLPFGVVLFAILSFSAIPEIRIILNKDKKLMKKSIITSVIVCTVFYTLFTFVVVGFKGVETPEIATLALGKVFVLLGIFTMFTSYLAIGGALQQNFMFDDRMKKTKAWFLSSVGPIILFLITQLSDYFSFTRLLSIGGVVSGGLTGILILFMVRNAKKNGDRKPEYKLSINWWIIIILSLIFVFGILSELV